MSMYHRISLHIGQLSCLGPTVWSVYMCFRLCVQTGHSSITLRHCGDSLLELQAKPNHAMWSSL